MEIKLKKIKEKVGETVYEEEFSSFRIYLVTEYMLNWIKEGYPVIDKKEFYDAYFNLSLKIYDLYPIPKNTFFFILNVLTSSQGYLLKESRRPNKNKVLMLKRLETVECSNK